ncbi:MAG TPA: hypothetical protein PLN85_02115 [archaeon]|nr:hypothetical protein [archaeon]HRT02884.1 hypothetical protein [Candidatus Diapherotrites archaeon]
MKIDEEELLNGKWIPRDQNVVVAIRQTKSNIIIPETANTSDYLHDIIVVAVDPDIKDLNIGDKVIVSYASLVELPVVNVKDKNTIYAYTKQSFIKLKYGS